MHTGWMIIVSLRLLMYESVYTFVTAEKIARCPNEVPENVGNQMYIKILTYPMDIPKPYTYILVIVGKTKG